MSYDFFPIEKEKKKANSLPIIPAQGKYLNLYWEIDLIFIATKFLL